jgi:hypothetical protein
MPARSTTGLAVGGAELESLLESTATATSATAARIAIPKAKTTAVRDGRSLW